MFPRRQVERSFQKFNDTVQDLFRAPFQAWDDTLARLMTHCEQDPVMKLVTDPLKSSQDFDAKEWFEEASNSAEGTIGTGTYKLPSDDEQRTALIYQVLLLVQNGLSINDFCIEVFGVKKYQDMVSVFNQELVLKFTREVSYRLQEILQDIGDEAQVPESLLYVFNLSHSVVVQGNVQGANIANSGSTVSGSTATFESAKEFADSLSLLADLLNTVKTELREEVSNAIEVLKASLLGSQISEDEVKQAAVVIASSSPQMKAKIKEFLGRLGTSLIGSTIFQAIKSAFGFH